MLKIAVVDAFADKPFAGNPAGVCVTDAPLEDDLMQKIASEMKHAETAFLVPRENYEWSLRWFTPAIEVDLCGHATLGSAHQIFEQRLASEDAVLKFHTRSGVLTAKKIGELIELDFPAIHPKPLTFGEDVFRALGTVPLFTGREGFFVLFEVSSAETVRKLNPDLKTLVHLGVGSFIVSARSDEAHIDIISRCFVPGAGIDEDPVTGSAHCALAPYWSAKLGKTILNAYQASERGGALEIEVRGERVLLRGKAVTVLRGELYV